MKLGLLFLRRTDKQGWFRYFVMIVAIALAMVALLSSLALGNAMSAQRSRSAWVSQIAYNNKLSVDFPLNKNAKDKTLFSYEITNYDYRTTEKQEIQELGIRQISQNSPLIPGLKRQPKANEMLVSPALFELISREPILKSRYKKYNIRLGVPDQILESPDTKLAIYKLSDQWLKQANQSHKTASAFGHSDLKYFSEIPDTAVQIIITTFMLICGLGVCFPMLILLISAMRIGMIQREQRYAALSLIGASKRQVNNIILSEALASTGIGVVFGVIFYELTRITILANLKFGKERFFLNDIKLSLPFYLGIIALVFLVVIIINSIALSKVKSSPLGVVKVQKLPRKPSVLGLIPFVIAAASIWKFNQAGSEWFMKNAEIGMMWFAGIFLLIMIGLLTSGAFITRVFASLLNLLSRKLTGVMVAKRLQRFARTIFSSVSGVVLALFVSSFFMSTLASVELTYTSMRKQEKTAFDIEQTVNLDNTVEVVRTDDAAKYESLFTAIKKQPLLAKNIKSHYNKQYFSEAAKKVDNPAGDKSGELYSCKDITKLTKMSCPSHMQPDDQVILVKNYEKGTATLQPFSPELKGEISNHAVIFVFKDRATANLGREYFRNITYDLARNGNKAFRVSQSPFTIFDSLSSIAGLVQLISLGTALSIVVAGFSIAVATIGGLFERKKSFSNLRLIGVSPKQLGLVVLLESILPMLLASVGAILTGVLTAKYLAGVTAGDTNKMLFAWPKLDYLGLVALALLGAVVIICLTLPILKQITNLEQNRTE